MNLQELLQEFRDGARSEREKGNYFERLIRVFLENDDPRYPMELFRRVITVSLETMRIVNGLPGLEID